MPGTAAGNGGDAPLPGVTQPELRAAAQTAPDSAASQAGAAHPDTQPDGGAAVWMNRDEIDEAVQRWRDHPVLGPATRTLASLRDWTDANSDGWPYWQQPSRAASRLMELIVRDGTWQYRDGDRPDATAAELRKAYASIRAFITKREKNGPRPDFTIYEPGVPDGQEQLPPARQGKQSARQGTGPAADSFASPPGAAPPARPGPADTGAADRTVTSGGEDTPAADWPQRLAWALVTTGRVQKPGYIPADKDHANLVAVLEEAAAHQELSDGQISMLRAGHEESTRRRAGNRHRHLPGAVPAAAAPAAAGIPDGTRPVPADEPWTGFAADRTAAARRRHPAHHLRPGRPGGYAGSDRSRRRPGTRRR